MAPSGSSAPVAAPAPHPPTTPPPSGGAAPRNAASRGGTTKKKGQGQGGSKKEEAGTRSTRLLKSVNALSASPKTKSSDGPQLNEKDVGPQEENCPDFHAFPETEDEIGPEEDTNGIATEETEVLKEWDAAETAEPTNPYRILRARREDPPSHIDALLKSRLQQLGDDGRGAAGLLAQRLRRAHRLLSDSEARQTLDESLDRRRAEGAWAEVRYTNGVYEGGVKTAPGSQDPIRDGKGVSVLTNGEKFEGSFVDDRQHGVGMQLWSNGDVFVGQWAQGSMHGQGVYYYGTGAVYIGGFAAGQRHGRGRLTWRNQSHYVGDFDQGVRTGQGVLTYYKGKKRIARYEGAFLNNRKHGDGIFVAVSQGRYEGQFVEDKFHGLGQISLPHREFYKGSFAEGRFHGEGAYFWGSGDRYEGEMRRGRIGGHGRFNYQGMNEPSRDWKASYEGQWLDGEPHGKGELSGDFSYVGEWSRGLKSGFGVYSWPGEPGGGKYVGHFMEDLRHGKGRIEWSDGSAWEGFLENDARHGMASFLESVESFRKRERKDVDKIRDEMYEAITKCGFGNLSVLQQAIQTEDDAKALLAKVLEVANIKLEDPTVGMKTLMEIAHSSKVLAKGGARSAVLVSGGKVLAEDVKPEGAASSLPILSLEERWHHGVLVERSGKRVRPKDPDANDLLHLEVELGLSSVNRTAGKGDGVETSHAE